MKKKAAPKCTHEQLFFASSRRFGANTPTGAPSETGAAHW
jgi:hypothetical protein